METTFILDMFAICLGLVPGFVSCVSGIARSDGCLESSGGCLELSVWCLDLSEGCLDLSFGCILSFLGLPMLPKVAKI